MEKTRWTAQEDSLISKKYPSGDLKELSLLLRRNRDMIVYRAKKLKVRRLKYWTEEKKDLLKQIYPKYSQKNVLEKFDRSWWDIRTQARKLNLKRPKSCPRWSNDEIKLLQENYTNESKDKILNLLSNRTWVSIYWKAEQLGIKRKIISNLKITKINISDFDRGYIAGMLDGEGCIYYHENKTTFQVVITITNTNRVCLEYIQKVLGFGRITTDKSKLRKYPLWKPSHKLEIARQGDVIGLLNTLQDYLIIKKQKSIDCLQHLNKWSNSEYRKVREYMRYKLDDINKEKEKTDYKGSYSRKLFRDYYSNQNYQERAKLLK